MENTRSKTAEEVRREFLGGLERICVYWANIPDKTPEERCNGLVFSILNIFDGTTGLLPPLNIVLQPHPDDRGFLERNGENWYQQGMVINDCLLHGLWVHKGDVR